MRDSGPGSQRECPYDGKAHGALRTRRHRDRGRRDSDHPAGRGRAGDHAHARLQGRAVRSVQVLRPRRRRSRPRPVLHVRAARLRAGGRLHAAVSCARLRGPDDRAPQLRRGDDPLGAADPTGRRRGGVQRKGHARHAASRGAVGGAHSAEVLPWPVRRLRRARPGRHAVVLDGEHVQYGQWTARVRHQDLPGRDVLPVSGHRGVGRRPARDHGAVRRVHPEGQARRRSGVRRWGSRDGAHPVAAAFDGGARHRPEGDLLLRRTRASGPVFRRGTACAGGGAASLPLRPGTVRTR